MSKIEKIIVNNKTYQVQTLGVLDTLNLHLVASKNLGPIIGKISEIALRNKSIKDIEISEIGEVLTKIEPDKIKELQLKTFSQVITPENTFLGDLLSIENWFSREDNAQDVWEVFIKALFLLLGEYLPNSVKGMFMKTAENSEKQSQKNTK